MLFRLVLLPSARKELDKLGKRDRVRVDSAFGDLLVHPFSGKQLDGEYKGYYTIRVWPYRIIYQVRKKELVVVVVRVRHRKDAYK